MSALVQKRPNWRGAAIRRFVPKAAASNRSINSLLDHLGLSLFDDLVGAQQERFWDRQAKRLGGRQIDDEIELCRLLDRDVGWLRSAQNLVDIVSSAPEQVRPVYPVGHQTSHST